MLGREERLAALRVSGAARQGVAEALVPVAVEALGQLAAYVLGWLAECSGELCEKVLEGLARRGVTDPSLEDVLLVVEEDLGGRLPVAEIYAAAPRAVKLLVAGAVIAARRLGRREWFERLTPEAAAEAARRCGAEEFARLVERFPRTSAALIEWLRGELLAERGD